MTAETLVIAVDRDGTVDVNPPKTMEPVPLSWVRHWATATPHEVWAIGNQRLVEEAEIPGVRELLARWDGEPATRRGDDERWPRREDRLHLLSEVFPDADGHVVIDDADVSHVEGWTHYLPWEFVEAVRAGTAPVAVPEE